MIALAGDDRSDLRRWMMSSATIAFVYGVAIVLHATWRPADTMEASEPSGAIVVELAPLPAAPSTVPTDMPPGPEQVMSEARPVAKPDAAPEDTPDLPSTSDPDAVAIPRPDPQRDVAPEQSVAAPATSAPSSIAERVAPVAAAPRQGNPKLKETEAVVTWRTQLLSLIEKNKRYPDAARSRREQGTAQVSFTIDRKGLTANARVIQSSGSNALDEEAVALLKRAEPFPSPPATFPGDVVVVRLPIRFTVK